MMKTHCTARWLERMGQGLVFRSLQSPQLRRASPSSSTHLFPLFSFPGCTRLH
jgi:hypothetical protein